MNSELMTDLSNMLIALVSVWVFGVLAARTKGKLGQSFRLFLASPVILTISATLKLAERANFFSNGKMDWIHYGSRFIATAFLVWGLIIFIKAVDKINTDTLATKKRGRKKTA